MKTFVLPPVLGLDELGVSHVLTAVASSTVHVADNNSIEGRQQLSSWQRDPKIICINTGPNQPELGNFARDETASATMHAWRWRQRTDDWLPNPSINEQIVAYINAVVMGRTEALDDSLVVSLTDIFEGMLLVAESEGWSLTWTLSRAAEIFSAIISEYVDPFGEMLPLVEGTRVHTRFRDYVVRRRLEDVLAETPEDLEAHCSLGLRVLIRDACPVDEWWDHDDLRALAERAGLAAWNNFPGQRADRLIIAVTPDGPIESLDSLPAAIVLTDVGIRTMWRATYHHEENQLVFHAGFEDTPLLKSHGDADHLVEALFRAAGTDYEPRVVPLDEPVIWLPAPFNQYALASEVWKILMVYLPQFTTQREV